MYNKHMTKDEGAQYSVVQDKKFIEFLEKKDEKLVDFLTDKFGVIDESFEKVDERFEKVDERFEKIESRLDRIENTMVTKDYLDKKLADLEGKLILIIKRGDEKFNLLVEILLDKKVISPKDVDKINSIELFPSSK